MTTLLIPCNANSSKLLSYQIAEDAANSTCAPSYNLQKTTNPNATSSIEAIFIEAALNKGVSYIYAASFPPNLLVWEEFLASRQFSDTIKFLPFRL